MRAYVQVASIFLIRAQLGWWGESLAGLVGGVWSVLKGENGRKIGIQIFESEGGRD